MQWKTYYQSDAFRREKKKTTDYTSFIYMMTYKMLFRLIIKFVFELFKKKLC